MANTFPFVPFLEISWVYVGKAEQDLIAKRNPPLVASSFEDLS